MKQASVFWFTGLSGAGKTTVAKGAKDKLEKKLFSVLILDGDDVRGRFHKNLGFTAEDIRRNNDLIALMCKDNRHKYDIILVPIISPFKDSREKARVLLVPFFYEVYFNADLSCVIKRDVKGLYGKAQKKEIDNLIGFSPRINYEPPESADLTVNSGVESSEESIQSLFDFILSKIEISVKERLYE